MKTNGYSFKKAVPVWECGTQYAKNRTIAFVCTFNTDDTNCQLSIAGSSSFIIKVNGTLVAHGPARAAHGFYRVDEHSLGDFLTVGENNIEIRASGYNVHSFEYLDQPSFLCAEIYCGDKLIACTGVPCTGFDVFGIDERITRVHKYSFQRTFTENYRLDSTSYNYSVKKKISVEATENKTFICRDLPYGEYRRLYPIEVMGRGKVSYSEKPSYFNDRAIVNISEDSLKGYRADELELATYIEIGKMDFANRVDKPEAADNIEICENTYADVDMGVNHTGIVEFELEALSDCELYITFDEVLIDGHIDCFRFSASNIMAFFAKKGTYKITTAEPYVMRYVRFIAKSGCLKIKNFKLVEVAFPMSRITARFVGEDKVMEKIYNAALESFRSNTVDIYMDCPSRERAGWLCDSFFTSRVENLLTGKSEVERQFLANFIMTEQHKGLPEGMLSMCYPADHGDRVYIPNWAMWYVLELNEYLDRTGDRSLIDDARDKMYKLYRHFTQFENEYGLLENLGGWVFVEWSHANQLLKDVSFPTNMLYAQFLLTLGRLYDDDELTEKGSKIKDTVREMAMTESGFFCDNAIRRDGKLVLSGERTEVCQYYAFFFDIATPESHNWLWNTMANDFGPRREETGKYPEIYPANAFIGNYLRLDLLNRYGYKKDLYDNIKGYFEYMADRTGTLWEFVGTNHSCNHGFTSHVICWMKSLGLVE